MKSLAISFVVCLAAISTAKAQDARMSFFVTSQGPGDGANLGGLKGADAHCQRLAEAAGITGKTWRAYLSTGTVSARSRIGRGPWHNAKGVLIARTVAGLHGRGNRRVDSMTNILENPHVGLILFLPGYEETVRIRGRAVLTTDPDDLAGMAVNGKAPELGIKIAVDTAFYHCAKALKRSKLWSPESQALAEGYPKFAQIIRDQYMHDADAEAIDGQLQKAYRDDLY